MGLLDLNIMLFSFHNISITFQHINFNIQDIACLNLLNNIVNEVYQIWFCVHGTAKINRKVIRK